MESPSVRPGSGLSLRTCSSVTPLGLSGRAGSVSARTRSGVWSPHWVVASVVTITVALRDSVDRLTLSTEVQLSVFIEMCVLCSVPLGNKNSYQTYLIFG